MATVVLGVAGSVALGPVGGILGATVGSYIDNAFLFPLIFPEDEPEPMYGSRVGSLQVQTASEGTGVKYCLGPGIRISGTVIWVSTLIEVANETPGESVGKGGGGTTSPSTVNYYYYVDVAVAICEGEIEDIDKVWADGVLIYDSGEDPRYSSRVADEIRFYPGSMTQDPDDIIEAYEGASEVPAFRGTAYMLFHRLYLGDFGNRIPQFSFQVKAESSKTVQSALVDILTRAGLDATDYDVTAVTGNLDGYAVPGPQKTSQVLSPLMTAFDLVARQSNGVLVIEPRETSEVTVLDPDSLAAHEEDSDPARPAEISEVFGGDLPREVNLQYIDKDADYQQGSQRERRIQTPADTVVNLNLAVAMNGATAREIASRELWQPWVQRQVIKLQLPPSSVTVEANDILEVTMFDDTTFGIFVKRVDVGINSLLVVEGVVEATGGQGYSGIADAPDLPANALYVPPDISFYLCDIPPIIPTDIVAGNGSAYLYIAQCTTNPDLEYAGAFYYESFTSGELEYQNGYAPIETVMGTADTVLASGPEGYWDRENTVDVVLTNGTLANADEDDIYRGGYMALLGDEIIAFENAAPTGSPRTYRLGKLLRGLRGTEWAINSHSMGERFVLLTNMSGALSVGVNRGFLHLHIWYGVSSYWKCISPGGDATTAAETQLDFQANGVKPFSPVHITGSRNTANDLTISWIRRTRMPVKLFSSPGIIPLLESEESYVVEILANPGDATPLRTIVVDSATSVVYPATGDGSQTEDGLTPGDLVNVRIAQVSTSGGPTRGFAREGTI